MFGFAKKIDEEIQKIQRIMDYYAEDFERIESGGPRGSLLLRPGKKTTSVELQKEAESLEGVRRRDHVFLGAANSEKALEYARLDYLAKLNRILKKNARELERMRSGYTPYDLDSVLDSLSAASKMIIRQAGGYDYLYSEASDRMRLNCGALSMGGSLRRDDPRQKLFSIAASGRRVRSKGEVIIDIMLDHYHIPHDHEKKIELVDENGFKVIRIPDFTLYCPLETLIWEHLGMLDKDDYLFSNAKKIQLYNRNGIVLWDNLIITMDGPGGTVNAAAIDDIIRSFVLPKMRR